MKIRWLGYGLFLLSSACVLDMSPETNAPILEPEKATIVAEGEFQFLAAAPTPIAWSVSEPTGGLITDEGIYTAPDIPGTYHVVASNDAGSDSATITVVDAFVRLLKTSGFVPTTLAGSTDKIAIVGETTSGDTLVAVFTPTNRSFHSVHISSPFGLSVRGAAATEHALVLVGTTANGAEHPLLLALDWNANVVWATEITNATGRLTSASISSTGDILAAGRAAMDGALERPLLMMVSSTGASLWAKLGDCEACLVSSAVVMGAYRVVGGNKPSSNWLAAFQADGSFAWYLEIKGVGSLHSVKSSLSGDRLVLGGSTNGPSPWVATLNTSHDRMNVTKVDTPLPLIYGDIAVTPLSTFLFGVSEDSPWLGSLTSNGELAWQQVLETSVGGTTFVSGQVLGANLFGLGTFGPAEPMFLKLPISGVPNLGMQSKWTSKNTDFQVRVDEIATNDGTPFSFQPFALQTTALDVTQANGDFEFAK